MSTFGGHMLEYKFVSIDRFDGSNLKSTVYFLSHNHADHTVGLGNDAFAQRLESSPDIKLYCSSVTKDLLLADERYSKLSKSIVALPMQEQTTIETTLQTADDTTNKAQSFCVTLLPAGHCMGSVMFLFEGSEGCVLYTGDFRLAVGDAARMKQLHTEPTGHTKEIKSMYLDTTFLLPEVVHIPSREESRDHAFEIAESWLAESRSNMIILRTKAYIGYEYLMIELAKHFKTKIHVDEKKYQMYCKCSDEIAQHVTTDPSETQIHACTWGANHSKESPLPCGYSPIMLEGSSLQARTILPSTMYFARNHGYDKNFFRPSPKKGCHRVCYSFHSSYTEIRDFVTYLKPHRAYLNVVPPGQKFQETQNRLNGFLDMVHSAHSHGGAGDGSEHVPLRLKRRRQRSEDTPADDSQPDSLLGELSGLTPKKRQKTEDTTDTPEGSEEKMDSQTSDSQSSNREQAGDCVIDNEADDSQGHELSAEESIELQSQLCIDSDELSQRSAKMKSVDIGEIKMLIDNSDDEDDDELNEDELLGLSDDEANKTDPKLKAKEDSRLKSIIEKLGDKVGDITDLAEDEDSENQLKTDSKGDESDCEVIELSDEENDETPAARKTALPPPPEGIQHGLVVSSPGSQATRAPYIKDLPEGATMQGGAISVPKGFVPVRHGDEIVLVPANQIGITPPRQPRIPKNMTKIDGVETFDITESDDEEEIQNDYSDDDSYLDESVYSSESDYSGEDDQSLAQVDLKRLNEKMTQKICTCGTDDNLHDDDCLAYNPADDDDDNDEILFLESVDSPKRSPESEERIEKEVQALKNKINQIEADRVEKESENTIESKDEDKKDSELDGNTESKDDTNKTDDVNDHKDENGINEDDLLKDDNMDNNDDENDDILNEDDLLGNDISADTGIKENTDKVKDIVEDTDISDVLQEIDAAV